MKDLDQMVDMINSKEKILKKPVPKGYIDTLDYGLVPIRYQRQYLLDLVDIVELVNGTYYEIWTNTTGMLVAIKNDTV